MSKYIFITGTEKNPNTLRTLLLRAYSEIQEMKDIGDEDSDHSTYLVYSFDNGFKQSIQSFSDDYNLKTVEIKPEYELRPSLEKKATFERTFKEWNRLKVIFENSDIVVCLGDPTEYSNSAHQYGCKVIHYK